MRELDTLNYLLDQAGNLLNQVLSHLDEEAHDGELTSAQAIDEQLRGEILSKITRLALLIEPES